MPMHLLFPGIGAVSQSVEWVHDWVNTWLIMVSLNARTCGWVMGPCCQKQVIESGAARRGAVFAHFTPTQTHFALWCLCAFANEEILVPGWDIAVSWATSAPNLNTTPADRDGALWEKTLQLHHAEGGLALPLFSKSQIRFLCQSSWTEIKGVHLNLLIIYSAPCHPRCLRLSFFSWKENKVFDENIPAFISI